MAADRIKLRASKILSIKIQDVKLHDRHAVSQDGRSISLAGWLVFFSRKTSPPPFAAQFAEVTVDTETGELSVDKLVMAVDGGIIVNPLTASGQIEGGMSQSLGYAVCEEMLYNANGQARERDFGDYHIFRADEMPALKTIFVETFEPSHPFGVKAVAEIPLDGVAPAVGNAVRDALGIEINEIPITPEKIWQAQKMVS